MQSMTPVIVKKGFLSSLASGFFTFLTVTVVCGTGIGAYAIHVFDKKSGDLTTIGGSVLENLPKWKESLPESIADAIHDRNADEYSDKLDVRVKLGEADRHNRRRVAVRIKNNGDETISLLTLNLVVKDSDGVPLNDVVSYAATPIAIDDDWRGPIRKGQEREYVRTVYANDDADSIAYEITQLRVTTPRTETTADSSVAKSD